MTAFLRICALMVLLAPLIPAAQAMTEPQPILVVAFGPFAGRGENGSATVVESLVGRRIGDHPIVTAVLPVEWGQPEQRIPELMAKHQPLMILGLGEGFPGRVAIETRAVNARAHADEQGKPPPTRRLGPAEETHRSSRLVIPDPLPTTDVPVVISQDAGRYLCNNLLWVCLGEKVDHAGFIHLPPQGEQSDAEYAPRFTAVVEACLAAQLASPAP